MSSIKKFILFKISTQKFLGINAATENSEYFILCAYFDNWETDFS